MTLEEAAEKVLRAARQAAYISANRVAGLEDKTDELMEAIKSYGDQRFIEGATAMREMAALKAYVAAPTRDIGKNVEQAVRAIDIRSAQDPAGGPE